VLKISHGVLSIVLIFISIHRSLIFPYFLMVVALCIIMCFIDSIEVSFISGVTMLKDFSNLVSA